ncbi:SEC-C domain-containing protein [Paenibacillus sp. ACRSA]|uniref:SEC-C domain-containing protein n=1 Tax=Paenibacillus sp. ACRSA TaxID=2918211 RepID=UPI001EF546B0|nr:SEC-C domain-containing protein [Paenibacillus sp. ACRSA]MCG7380070.1 SEC-C domain-containing protein [Paenibacillus sp. ACRSA]
MNENQYSKMIKSLTDGALRKLDESYDKNTYDYVLQNGFPDDDTHSLFNGINENSFCPCGSGQKYKSCCTYNVEKLVYSLENCKYVGCKDTTENRDKLPLSFRLSPIFQLGMYVNDGDQLLVKEIIKTHPTIVNHLYLISAKEISKAYSESEHARYLLNVIYDLGEEADANWEDFKKDNKPLNEKEKSYMMEQKITVPTKTLSMRKATIEWLTPSQFILN